MTTLTPALLFAAVGPNPASVTEAVWALYRQRGLCVVEAHLVAMESGRYWLEQELLGPHGVLGELRDALPGALPDQAAVVARTAERDGAAVADDVSESDAAHYRAAVWEAARACVERAGARPVIFLLAGGRRRTMTAYATTVYQLIARASDELVDVRVSDPRAEGGSGFFYPEQRQRELLSGAGVLDATTVGVQLVTVAVPRLAGLIAPAHRVSFEAALEASRQSIAAMTPPDLVVDLAAGEARVDGERLPLSAAQLCWYGLLAEKRRHDGAAGRGEVPADPVPLLQLLLGGVAAAPWAHAINDTTLRAALGLPAKDGGVKHPDGNAEQLKKLRADTRRAVLQWVRRRVRPAWEALLVPAPDKQGGATSQRIPLDPSYIRVVLPAP